MAILWAVARITDWTVLDTWQRFVADPLQFRGVSLDWQYAVFLIIALILLLSEVIHDITEHQWLIAAGFSLNLAVYLGRLLAGRPFRDPGPNPLRYVPLLTGVRLTLLWVSFFDISLLADLWLLSGTFDVRSVWVLFLHAAILCASCETKPPRPKVRQHMPIAEWI